MTLDGMGGRVGSWDQKRKVCVFDTERDDVLIKISRFRQDQGLK